jgi:hypothetical protein
LNKVYLLGRVKNFARRSRKVAPRARSEKVYDDRSL